MGIFLCSAQRLNPELSDLQATQFNGVINVILLIL